MPDDLHDRLTLLAAHWDAHLWYVCNLALRMGLDQLELYLHDHPDWSPESRASKSETQTVNSHKQGKQKLSVVKGVLFDGAV